MEERTTFLTLTTVGVGYGETSILILRLVLLLNSGKCGESSWFDVFFIQCAMGNPIGVIIFNR